jgi:hypothetical protein
MLHGPGPLHGLGRGIRLVPGRRTRRASSCGGPLGRRVGLIPGWRTWGGARHLLRRLFGLIPGGCGTGLTGGRARLAWAGRRAGHSRLSRGSSRIPRLSRLGTLWRGTGFLLEQGDTERRGTGSGWGSTCCQRPGRLAGGTRSSG